MRRLLSRLVTLQSWSGWFLCSLIVCLAVMLNWPVEYSSYARSNIGGVVNRHYAQIDVDDLTSPVMQVIGGWPFTWYIANHYQTSSPAVHASIVRLAGNLILFTLAVVFFWIYERRARHSTVVSGGSAQKFRRRFSLSDLVLAVTLVGMGMGYWQGLARYANHHARSLGSQARDKVAGTLDGQLPAWLSMQTTYFNSPLFLRVSDLELDQPDDETLAYALSLPTLKSLRMGGGSYDLKLLEGLRKLPMLTDLRISGRELDAGAIAAIGSCKQLQSLNLMRTDITAEGVRALGDMPKLKVLNLVHTDVLLSDLGRPEFADNLSVLLLPHHALGKPEDLVLDDWKQLQTLQIFEYDAAASPQPVKVTLRNLPALTKIGLDQFRVFDLTLDEVPKLSHIDTISLQADDRVRKQDLSAGVASLSGLKIHNASIFKPLELSALQLQSIDIQTNQPVSLQFRTNNVAQSQQNVNPHSQHYQKLFDQLGQCSGPLSLDLGGLDLRDVDLTAFSQANGISSLTMSYPLGTEVISHLSRLSLRELVLWAGMRPEQVADIVQRIPTLERLVIAKMSFDRIPMEGRQLKEIRFESLMSRTSNQVLLAKNRPVKLLPEMIAHLVDLPNLRAEASFIAPQSKVRIENVPALTQLKFFYPLPPRSVIRGLRDLKCFTGGGKELRDEHFDAVVACRDLETLCLLYTSVSSDKLKEIGRLEQLKCLSLNGSQVTDETLASWTNLKELRTLRLKQTQVTPTSLRLIPKLFPRLERLSIDVPIDEATLDELLKCQYIMDLGLVGSELSVEAIQKIEALPSLIQLDLSGCKLNQMSVQSLRGQFSNRNRNLILTEAENEATSSDPTLGDQFQSPFRFRLINESGPFTQFSPPANRLRDIWLDKDEIWDEPFIEVPTGKK